MVLKKKYLKKFSSREALSVVLGLRHILIFSFLVNLLLLWCGIHNTLIVTWVSEFSRMDLHLNILSIWHFGLFRIWDWPPQIRIFWMKWNWLKLNEMLGGMLCTLATMLFWHWGLVSMAIGQGINCYRVGQRWQIWVLGLSYILPSLGFLTSSQVSDKQLIQEEKKNLCNQ